MIVVKTDNKTYTYDYKQVLIQTDLHQRLKILAAKQGLSLSNLLDEMRELYENQNN